MLLVDGTSKIPDNVRIQTLGTSLMDSLRSCISLLLSFLLTITFAAPLRPPLYPLAL